MTRDEHSSRCHDVHASLEYLETHEAIEVLKTVMEQLINEAAQAEPLTA